MKFLIVNRQEISGYKRQYPFMDAAFFAYTGSPFHKIKEIMSKDAVNLEKSKKNPNRKREESLRQLKVNAVYGEMPLVECMKNIMKGKTSPKIKLDD